MILEKYLVLNRDLIFSKEITATFDKAAINQFICVAISRVRGAYGWLIG